VLRLFLFKMLTLRLYCLVQEFVDSAGGDSGVKHRHPREPEAARA